jgi:hypothetical protein
LQNLQDLLQVVVEVDLVEDLLVVEEAVVEAELSK